MYVVLNLTFINQIRSRGSMFCKNCQKTSKMELFVKTVTILIKAINHFHRKLHLRYMTVS